MARAWSCLRCRADLGDIREGALHVRPGTRVYVSSPTTVEVTCRCGTVKLWFGGRVIVTGGKPARLSGN